MGEIINKIKEKLCSSDKEQFAILMERFKFENLLNINISNESEDKFRFFIH